MASLVQIVRFAVNPRLRIFGLDTYLLKGIRKPEAGLHMPVDGVVLCTDPATLGILTSCTLAVAGQHKFRKSSDLARPYDLEPNLGGDCTADRGRASQPAQAVRDIVIFTNTIFVL